MSGALLLLVAVTGATPSPARQLKQAVELMERLEFEQANAAFHKLLDSHPPTSEAARAHLYLGLIAFNGLDIDLARAEFRQALALNPALEVPFDSSPKARLMFSQVQHDITRESTSVPVPLVSATPPPAAPVPSVLVMTDEHATFEHPGAKRPIPTAFWITLGLGAALAGTGVGFGLYSAGTVSSANAASDIATTVQLQNQATTQRIVADSCYGAAIVAGVVATVLFFARGSVEPEPVVGQ